MPTQSADIELGSEDLDTGEAGSSVETPAASDEGSAPDEALGDADGTAATAEADAEVDADEEPPLPADGGPFAFEAVGDKVRLIDHEASLRAHMLFAQSYKDVMKLGHGHEWGIRSYFEKKRDSTSGYTAVAKGVGVGFAVAGLAVSSVSVVPVLITLPMAVAGFAIKQALKRRKRAVRLKTVQGWERRLRNTQRRKRLDNEEPLTPESLTTTRDELEAAILRVGVLGEVVYKLAGELLTLRVLRDRYYTLHRHEDHVELVKEGQRWGAMKRLVDRDGPAAWRQFAKTNGYLDSAIAKSWYRRAAVKVQGAWHTHASAKGDDPADRIRLAVKRITFYNALLMSFAAQHRQEQQKTVDALNGLRVNLWKALRQQAHLTCGHHGQCSELMPCQRDWSHMTEQLQTFQASAGQQAGPSWARGRLAGEVLEPGRPEDLEAQATLSAADAEAEAERIATRLALGDPAELFDQSVVKAPNKYSALLAQKLHGGMAQKKAGAAAWVAKKGLTAATTAAVKQSNVVDEATAEMQGVRAIGMEVGHGRNPYARRLIDTSAWAHNMAVLAPGATVGFAFGQLSDFAIGHYSKNVNSRLVLARLEKEFEAEKAVTPMLLQFAQGLELQEGELDDAYFLRHLSSYMGGTEAGQQRKEVKAAVDKLSHYERRFKRDEALYAALQEKVGAAGHFESCDEALALSRHFVAMFKTLRKEEACVNFVHALAMGVRAMLRQENDAYGRQLPVGAAESVEAWLAFWMPGGAAAFPAALDGAGSAAAAAAVSVAGVTTAAQGEAASGSSDGSTGSDSSSDSDSTSDSDSDSNSDSSSSSSAAAA